MNTTERASHPSRAQIESLLEFLERNPNLAKGFSKVPSARDAARRSWQTLALQLNSMGGCVKTWKQWTKYWADKKCAVKKKCSLNAQRRLLGSPTQNQAPSPINTPSSPRRRQRRRTLAPPSQHLSQFSRMTERFLAIEEHRIEVDRRNSLLLEAIVNHARERDTAICQALLAIGEGLKLLAEALKQNSNAS